MISPFGLFVSYQVNVDAIGNNIIGDAANECSISVDPTDGNRMAIGWRQFNSVSSNFRQGGWGYTTDAGTTGPFPVSWKIMFSAATPSQIPMRQETFSISVSCRRFVTICGARLMVVNPGRACRPTVATAEATRSGSPSIRPAAWGMASSTRAWSTVATIVGSEQFQPLHRRRRHLAESASPFLIRPYGEHSMWIPTAICSLAVKRLQQLVLLRSLQQRAETRRDTHF